MLSSGKCGVCAVVSLRRSGWENALANARVVLRSREVIASAVCFGRRWLLSVGCVRSEVCGCRVVEAE